MGPRPGSTHTNSLSRIAQHRCTAPIGRIALLSPPIGRLLLLPKIASPLYGIIGGSRTALFQWRRQLRRVTRDLKPPICTPEWVHNVA